MTRCSQSPHSLPQQLRSLFSFHGDALLLLGSSAVVESFFLFEVSRVTVTCLVTCIASRVATMVLCFVTCHRKLNRRSWQGSGTVPCSRLVSHWAHSCQVSFWPYDQQVIRSGHVQGCAPANSAKSYAMAVYAYGSLYNPLKYCLKISCASCSTCCTLRNASTY